MSEQEEQRKYPPRVELSNSLIIRLAGVALTMISLLVSVTAFVVKTSFPSDTAKQAYDISLKNQSDIANLQNNLGNISVPARLAALEAEYSQTLENQKDIKKSLDNLNSILMNNYINNYDNNRNRK